MLFHSIIIVGDQILVENGHFSWGGEEDEPVLSNINIRIPRGLLVAVVGAVGSGKSSLISALLGDMVKLSGRVNIKGIFKGFTFNFLNGI